MKNRSFKLLFSEVVFILLQYILLGMKQADITAAILTAIGSTVIPFSNAYLLTRYGQGWIQQHELISMLLVGLFSSFFLPAGAVIMIILIVIMVIKNLGTKPPGATDHSDKEK